jgi:hypothetical protein
VIPVPSIVWKIGGVLLAMAIVAAGATFEIHRVKTQAVDAYKQSQTVVAQKQVITNQTAVAGISASEAAGLRQIAATAQESRNEIQKRNDALVGTNAALADTVSRLQHRLAGTNQQPVVVSKAAAGGREPDAASDATLPVGLADLVKFNAAQFLAADEDAVTITALQAVVTQDRQICNGSLPGLI